MAFRMLSLALLVALAACSQAGGSNVPAAPGQPLARRAAHARLTIHVPRCRHRRCRGRREHFISPATALLAYSIDATPQTGVAISPSNPACTVVGTISYLTCTISFAVAPGQHVFSFTAEDANGAPLSADTDVPVTVKTGQANPIAVTLGGIAASLAIAPVGGASVRGDQFHGFTVYGDEPQRFSAVALDADENFIVGPGSPQPRVSATPASMTLATPAPNAPNTFALTSTYESTDPEVSQSSSLTVVATPVPDSGGTTVSATVPLTLVQPWVYVVDDADNTVKAFDEQGHPKTTPGGFPSLESPNGIAYDPDNGLLYVGNSSPARVQVYNRAGVMQGTTLSTGNVPQGLAYDPALQFLYVTFGSSGTVAAFNESGVQQTLTGTPPFSGLGTPVGIAYAPSGTLYVTDLMASIGAFDEQGNSVALTGSFAGHNSPTGIAYDSHRALLYAVNNGNSTVTVYDVQGNQQTSSGFATTQAVSIAYDANADWFYVGSCTGSNDVSAFDAAGNAITTAANWPGNVTGIAVIP
ncbi:MAG: hypothetical protein JO199_00430 [Candidatus Eremiobacteraeota bacterium]|nr:hypothetical protein [Candidatus Eremiobacteraeota bacterium]